ncbi:hypothetical protein FZEAL_10891 [Fusarium zealandicum]|uniref:DUF6546 domain-containing protein n=1 Tax=Fusarium zealandicum TaxID=1053134 RepID=A0A8H4TUA4_9HYPO|nr:hypothetical protein FZEAL_10891 [Fusarium zealandicum]
MDAFAARSSWASLSPEIHMLILQCIIPKYGSIETRTDRGFGKASSLATVSREWQSFFEKETFRRMALVSSDLPAFAKAVRGKNAIRLNYINRLWLHIELAEYTRRIYSKPESATNIAQNNRTFTYAMAALLNALSSWDGIRGGLRLEINAHSPSDQKYHPLEFAIHDDYPFKFEEDLERYPSFSEYRRQGRLDCRVAGITRHHIVAKHGMMRRLRGTPLELQPWLFQRHQGCGNSIRNLPQVPIVKGLLLRQEFFRGIAPTSLARLLRDSFVALESFRYERWMARRKTDEHAFFNDLHTHLIPALPASVEGFFLSQQQRWDIKGPWPKQKLINQISWFLGTICHRFVEFCPPIEFAAKLFLRQIVLGGTREGSKLKHLSLRADQIQASSPQSAVTYFLSLAARAAKHLPRLRVLELWNCGHGFGYIFRYTQDDSRATITWRPLGTDFALEPKVLKTWAKVASDRVFSVERIPFTEADVGDPNFMHASIIPHLALRRLAFDPITEARIVSE